MTTNLVDYQSEFHYAGTRIRGTIVRDSEGYPVYVDSVNDENGVVYIKYPKGHGSWGKGKEVHLSSLNLEPMPLGYVNLSRGTVWASRVPARHYKQGLNSTNFTSFGRNSMDVFSGRIIQAVLNKYPSLLDCLDTLMNDAGVKSKAFSRDFALSRPNPESKTVKLIYRGQVDVGRAKMSDSQVTVHLNEKYHYLNEVLEKSLA